MPSRKTRSLAAFGASVALIAGITGAIPAFSDSAPTVFACARNDGERLLRYVAVEDQCKPYETLFQLSPGSTGAPGADGSHFFDSPGVPENTVGHVGDMYINTTNGDLYQKTGLETWTKVGNLRGPAGSSSLGRLIRATTTTPELKLPRGAFTTVNSISLPAGNFVVSFDPIVHPGQREGGTGAWDLSCFLATSPSATGGSALVIYSFQNGTTANGGPGAGSDSLPINFLTVSSRAAFASASASTIYLRCRSKGFGSLVSTSEILATEVGGITVQTPAS